MPAFAITRSTGWASSKLVSQRANLSRSTTSIVSATTVAPLARHEAARVAAGQRERHAGSGIVERQRLADAARGAGDDDAGELLHGITFGRGALYALGADTRVPRRGAASGVQWSWIIDRKHDGIRSGAGIG
jgi:hypothetical protein